MTKKPNREKKEFDKKIVQSIMNKIHKMEHGTPLCVQFLSDKKTDLLNCHYIGQGIGGLVVKADDSQDAGQVMSIPMTSIKRIILTGLEKEL